MRGLRDAYPETRFLVFTTPIRQPLLDTLIASGRLPDHARRLAVIAAVFGEVRDFMGPNSVTTEPARYRDDQHFDERIGASSPTASWAAVYPKPSYFGHKIAPEILAAYLERLQCRIGGGVLPPAPAVPANDLSPA